MALKIKLLSIFALISVSVAFAASDCDLPPVLWCSDSETAERCGVTDQCRHWDRRVRYSRFEASLGLPRGSKPVNLTLAYESLCPGCRAFIRTQLWPVYQELKEYITVDLLPYGNAREYYNAKTGKWVFDCQHGPEECKGNLVETCAIFTNRRDESKYLPFIHCLEQGNPVKDGKVCANKTNLNWDRITECIDGAEGNVYQHTIALETPKHNYVPWVVFNGIHNEKIEDRALSNFKLLVCDAIPSPKPSLCVTKQPVEKCWNNHN